MNMKRFVSRVLSIVTVCVLTLALAAGTGTAEGEFSFNGSLSWNMGAKELVEKKGDFSGSYSDEDYTVIQYTEYDNNSGQSNWMYFFSSDRLVLAVCGRQMNEEELSGLCGELRSAYGTEMPLSYGEIRGIGDKANLRMMDDAEMSGWQFCQWEAPDRTRILLLTDSSYAVTILYVSPDFLSGDWKDAGNTMGGSGIQPAEEKKPMEAFRTVGSIVEFGRYEQDNNTENGPEPIEWIVVDAGDGECLLLSLYGLDVKRYNEEEWAETSWETCTLRKWLNEDFCEMAFSEEEQSMILPTVLKNDNRSIREYGHEESGEQDTTDRVFILSALEAGKYLNIKEIRLENQEGRILPTAYALHNSAFTSDINPTADGKPAGLWWTRTRGSDYDDVYIFGTHGAVTESSPWNTRVTVRPAIRLALDQQTMDAALETARLAKFRKAGSIVTFGHYDQDYDTSNGAEAIEWVVLEVQGDKCLLMSRYGLEPRRFNPEGMGNVWEDSELRIWLNEDFLHTAFTAEEQEAILLTEVDNSKEQGYKSWNPEDGNNTRDRMFILSFREALKYVGDKTDMKARMAPTVYARFKGAYEDEWSVTEDGDKSGKWWLRSPGRASFDAAMVEYDGKLGSGLIDSGEVCVRPVFWLDLNTNVY